MTTRARDGGAAAKPPLVSTSDIGITVGLPFLAVAACLLPQRSWFRFAAACAPYVARLLAPGPEAVAAAVARTAGGHVAAPAAVIGLATSELLRNLRVMRAALPVPGPEAGTLRGREHIDAALSRGAGVVLWDGHFAHAALTTKSAMRGAGLGLVHLSHPRHGFSGSRFGMKVLNPLWVRAEARHLAERVVLSLDGPVAAMRHLLGRLSENAVVSISVRDTGSQPVAAPFLGGALRLATGAPDLAYRSGAALIPVFTVLDGEQGYVTTAEAPIALPPGAPRRAAVGGAAAAYAARLEPWVLRYPDQWLGWFSLAEAAAVSTQAPPPPPGAAATRPDPPRSATR